MFLDRNGFFPPAPAKQAEKLLREISDSTALAEKEKNKVAVIVEAVTKKVGGHGCVACWCSCVCVCVCVCVCGWVGRTRERVVAVTKAV